MSSDYTVYDAMIARLYDRYTGAELERRVRYMQWKKENAQIKERLRAVAALRANRRGTR